MRPLPHAEIIQPVMEKCSWKNHENSVTGAGKNRWTPIVS